MACTVSVFQELSDFFYALNLHMFDFSIVFVLFIVLAKMIRCYGILFYWVDFERYAALCFVFQHHYILF